MELPIQATLHLLGVPSEDRHQLVAWTNATLSYEGRDLGESTDATRQAAAAMAEYAAALIARKRQDPGDDMLSTMVQARLPDPSGAPQPLSELELTMFFSLLIAAGSQTTRNAIALGLAALVEHPDQLARLRANPSPAVLGSAAEEILRWTSPTLYNRRTATRDVVLGGQSIDAGDKVTLWWASANRDEAVFADPFSFDLTRHPNPHLAFGSRAHYCLGATLARLEITLVLQELLARFDHIAMAGLLRRVKTNKHAGVSQMPLHLHRRPGVPSGRA